jgi:hypothetical protein
MLDTIAATLIDKNTGFFRWWDRDNRLKLYQTGLGWPLLTTTMDGFGAVAPWPQEFGKRRSETLFRALGRISPSWTGFCIKHHDQAYAEVSWARSIEDGTTLGIQNLDEFSSNPADQGGSSFLGPYATIPEHMILFSYASTECFRTSLFGELKNRIPDELQLCAGQPGIAAGDHPGRFAPSVFAAEFQIVRNHRSCAR